MALRFAELMFTPAVKAEQERLGSRTAYARAERPEAPARDRFGPAEAAFIAARDSFYVASVSETGWPYIQHRGGPPGFLKVLDDRTLGFADFRGNRQYVSLGNLKGDDRVALFLMDYPHRRRLKVLGHARAVDAASEPDLVAKLADPGYPARRRAWRCHHARGLRLELPAAHHPALHRSRGPGRGGALARAPARRRGGARRARRPARDVWARVRRRVIVRILTPGAPRLL